MPPDEVGQTEPPNKIVPFRIVPKEEPPETDLPAGPVIDLDAIKWLEEILERYRSGQLVGFAMVMGQADEFGNVEDFETFVTNRAFDDDMAFLGATMILQDHIKTTRDPNAIKYSDEDPDV